MNIAFSIPVRSQEQMHGLALCKATAGAVVARCMMLCGLCGGGSRNRWCGGIARCLPAAGPTWWTGFWTGCCFSQLFHLFVIPSPGPGIIPNHKGLWHSTVCG